MIRSSASNKCRYAGVLAASSGLPRRSLFDCTHIQHDIEPSGRRPLVTSQVWRGS